MTIKKKCYFIFAAGWVCGFAGPLLTLVCYWEQNPMPFSEPKTFGQYLIQRFRAPDQHPGYEKPYLSISASQQTVEAIVPEKIEAEVYKFTLPLSPHQNSDLLVTLKLANNGFWEEILYSGKMGEKLYVDIDADGQFDLINFTGENNSPQIYFQKQWLAVKNIRMPEASGKDGDYLFTPGSGWQRKLNPSSTKE